jgi:pseudaminic acid cytidylyltransferase
LADAIATRDAVCIIPARGGSKRVPGKNIRPLGGLPLIAHSIRAAIKSDIFARVIVSTDDEKIAAVAREHGAETPFMRSAELANDHATTAAALLDAISRSGETARRIVCCLYATAPMVQPFDFIAARQKLIENRADCVLSVTEYDFAPLRALAEADDGLLAFVFPQYELTRSQDLPVHVHDAGMFYMMDTRSLIDSGRIMTGRTFGHMIGRDRAIDIDTEEDFRFAELLFALKEKGDSHGG